MQDRTTWLGALETWLEREWRLGGKARLRKQKLDICWDDSDWLDALERHVQPSVATLVEGLADDLTKAKLQTYHSWRGAAACSGNDAMSAFTSTFDFAPTSTDVVDGLPAA